MNLLHSRTAKEYREPTLLNQLKWLTTGGMNMASEGLALGTQAHYMMTEIKGMSFIPMYKVFFLSLLLMVWGGFCLVVTVCLRVAIITRNRACGVWVFAAFWGTHIPASSLSLQLARQGDGGCY
jgi:hypothetical protein